MALPEEGSHNLNDMTDHVSNTVRAATTRSPDLDDADISALSMLDDEDMSSEQEDWDRIIGASGHRTRTSARLSMGGASGVTTAVRGKLQSLSPAEAALLDRDDDRSWRSMDSVHSRTTNTTSGNSSNVLEDLHGSMNLHDSTDSFASFGDGDGDELDDDDMDLSMQKAAFVRLSEDSNARRGLMAAAARSQSLRSIKRGSSFRGSLDLIDESKEALD